jgi:hypothetical protein
VELFFVIAGMTMYLSTTMEQSPTMLPGDSEAH